MRLIFVSGLSGAGKSVTLNMLEDVGFYCIDNLPAAMLNPFISHALRSQQSVFSRTAVGVDARNTSSEIESVPRIIEDLKRILQAIENHEGMDVLITALEDAFGPRCAGAIQQDSVHLTIRPDQRGGRVGGAKVNAQGEGVRDVRGRRGVGRL